MGPTIHPISSGAGSTLIVVSTLIVIGVDPVSIDPTPISVQGRFLLDHHRHRPLREAFTHD